MRSRRAFLRPVAGLTAVLAVVAGAALAAADPARAGAATATATETTADERAADEETGLEVVITAVGPAVLAPGQPLTVTGTVTNPTDRAVEAAQLSLRMQRYTPISRSALHRWLEPDSVSTTVLLVREDLAQELPAGASTPFSVTVDDVPLAAAQYAWGPHGIEVAVQDAADAAVTGADRSVLIWYPDTDVEPTPVSVLVPATPTRAERSASVVDRRPVAEMAAPRLLGLLGATDQPGVTAAVDGMLLAPPEGQPGTKLGSGAVTGAEAAEEPTGTPTAEPGPTGGDDGVAAADATAEPPPDATASPAEPDLPRPSEEPAGPGPGPTQGGWAALVAAVTDLADGDGREVRVLPWADADVAALAHTGAATLLAEQLERSAAAAESLGLTADTALAWPDTDRPDQVTTEEVARAGAAAVVLPSGSATPLQELTYTAAGRADLSLADGGALPAVLVDERLSAVLAGRLLPGEGAEDATPTDLDPVDARQMLLAETAVISRERPSDPRALVLALPRGFAGDVAVLADLLAELMAAPWVLPTTLSGVLARDAPALERGTLPDVERAVGELDGQVLRAMDAVVADAVSFASITAVPEDIVGPVERGVEQVLSSAWREAPRARAGLLDEVRADVDALHTQVAALPSSTLNLINYSGQLPVNVRNDLATEVTVQVRLEPKDPRLQAPEAVTLTVPAGSQATAQIPVRAVGSGDVPVEVELLTADGRRVGTPTDMQVRARPDWETVGTAVTAALLGVLLVVGLVRTVRRGPRIDPDEVLPTPEDGL